MTFSNNLRFLRKSYGYSQDFIAEKLGYKSFTTIQKWESGVSEPSVEKLRILAELFHITMDELLNDNLAIDTQKLNAENSSREQQLLSICRRLRKTNQNRLYEYASLLLRDEQHK